MFTDISKIENDEENSPKIHTDIQNDIKNLSRNIQDLSLDLTDRLKCVDKYYELYREDLSEHISKLITTYEMCGIKSIKEYLREICYQSNIDPMFKANIGQTFCNNYKKDSTGYEILDFICNNYKELSTIYKISLIKLLSLYEKLKENTLKYLLEIVDNTKLDPNFRYKIIFSFENMEDLSKELKDFYINNSAYTFFMNENNEKKYRLMSSQILLRNKFNFETVQESLIRISNVETEENTKADIADMILKYGDDNYKEKATQILKELIKHGNKGKRVTTIYENSQNVHNEEMEKSVVEGIEYLMTNYNIMKIDEKEISLEYVNEELLNFVKNHNIANVDLEKVNYSLERISFDRILYSKFSCPLKLILLKLWTYISGHKNEEEMKKRLLEELSDMAGTCSSGFVSRLINVMSGFGDFTIRLSWGDQINSNLNAILNRKIKEMDDLGLQEMILSEMTLQTGDLEKRRNFLDFFVKNISEIREELYEEFKNNISDTDFDLYFKIAVLNYEN